MEWLGPVDALFLLSESRQQPMHVGAVLLFEPPDHSGGDWVRAAHETLAADTRIDPMFRKRPTTLLGIGQPVWSIDNNIDLDYHVQRWRLPVPGGADELFELVAQLHAIPLERDRPLWELHLVDGLADGRVAVYAKIHHAMADGVAALRMLQRTLTTDATATEVRVPWRLSGNSHRTVSCGGMSSLNVAARKLLSAATFAPSLLRAVYVALADQRLVSPWQAPRTILNGPVGSARRCLGRSWPLERIRRVAKASNTTVNDVFLTMDAGALRGYLIGRSALPDKPLIAMIPVSLRPPGDNCFSAGNSIAGLLCALGTDVDSPMQRLQLISDSMRRSKQFYRGLSPEHAMAVSALFLSPFAVTQLPGIGSRADPSFNIVISNVPGPSQSIYWGGARLDASYPISIPVAGLALNMTVTNTGTNLDVGLTACRRTIPDLNPLFAHLDDTLAALERDV
jgi:WS/DGAT/MGAT family acyltransferase